MSKIEKTKIFHIGSSNCGPCITSKLAFEKLQELYPDGVDYNYISLDIAKETGLSHREALSKAYKDNNIEQPSVPMPTKDDSNSDIEVKLLWFIPQIFVGNNKEYHPNFVTLVSTLFNKLNNK